MEREYLRNVTRYPKSERQVIESDSYGVRRKKSDERTTCEFGPTQTDFFGRIYIFRRPGADGPLTFYTR